MTFLCKDPKIKVEHRNIASVEFGHFNSVNNDSLSLNRQSVSAHSIRPKRNHLFIYFFSAVCGMLLGVFELWLLKK